MILNSSKPFQMALWSSQAPQGAEPALRAQFDTLEEARIAFELHRQDGSYALGVLYLHNKATGYSQLLYRFGDDPWKP
jgi:hypothetical protein